MDTTTAVIILVCTAVLLMIVAAAETGVIAMSRSRARGAAQNGLAVLLDRYIRRRHAILSVLAVASSALTITGTLAVVALVADGREPTAGVLTLIGLGTLLVITLLRQSARGIALLNPERAGLLLSWPIAAMRYVFTPLIWVASAPVQGALRLVGRTTDQPPDPAAELLAVLQAPADPEMAEALREERAMMRAVLEMSEHTVREIMSPRVELAAVSTDASVGDVLRVINDTGFSRIPLYEESIDHIVGVIYAKDLLAFLQTGQVTPDLVHLARPPYFVPETKRADELLSDLRRDQVHMAIAVDEYGGTAGVVTVEDLIEEIVGEIVDEYDTEEELDVERIDDDEAMVDARLPIDDLNELFGTEIDSEDFDTVGGFIFSLLGRLAVPGDEVISEEHGLQLRVLSIRGRRIKKVRVTRVTPAEETAQAV